jgi:glyoxylase-like metal-dependent hydrolase (beta-lactamase superfamily II)/rhodanese-related sulfurtransferase
MNYHIGIKFNNQELRFMIFRQIRSKDDTGTLSYIIADEKTKNGVIIDPNIEDFQIIGYIIDELGIKLKYVIDTHTHADHVSAAGELKNTFGTKLIMHENTKNKWKVIDEGDKFGIGDILRENAKFKIDKYVNDGDTLELDSLKFKFLFTPGHTDNHISVHIDDMLFTGDLLLIGQSGRSDLPGGNTAEQYDSLFSKVITLPGSTKIYPGHDYEDNEFSYLADEKENNPFLQERTKEEYIEFVKDFFPPISEVTSGGKATLQCGTKRVINDNEPFKNINVKQLARMMKNENDLYLLDVREAFELMAFGQIPGVVNIPIREVVSRIKELPSKENKIVVVCQSGNRSYEVSHYLAKHGFSNVYNLEGGTTSWLYSNDPEVVNYQSA